MMPAEEEKPDRPPQPPLALYRPLADCGYVQIRLHRAEMYSRMCGADDTAAEQQLSCTRDGWAKATFVGTDLDAFDRTFAAATIAIARWNFR